MAVAHVSEGLPFVLRVIDPGLRDVMTPAAGTLKGFVHTHREGLLPA